MLKERYAKLGAIFLGLLLLNIVVYFWRNWGLITVKVHDVPLRKVVSSIEWQGWIKIYTNLPLDQKVTMYVDHVPLPEAMETLAESVSGPANGAPDRADRPDRGDRQGGDQAAGGPPPGGGQAGGGGGNGGGFRRGGGGGFGGGGGTSWNLAFFAAPTKALAEQEIRQFESGAALTNDDLKVYSYPTPLEMVQTDDEDAPIADPRRQVWPGYKPPAPPPPPAPSTDGSDANTTPTPPADPPGPPTVQTYLQAFAQSSDIWIMAPGSWAPLSPTAPAATSSIIRAVKRFVSSSHGAVIQAYILRGGLGGPRTRGAGGMEAMEDRMTNALNGLPPEDQEAARNQLVQEQEFYKSVQAAPQEQRPAMMRDHMQARMADHFGDRWRRSPTKRAQFYARIVANRAAATGK